MFSPSSLSRVYTYVLDQDSSFTWARLRYQNIFQHVYSKEETYGSTVSTVLGNPVEMPLNSNLATIVSGERPAVSKPYQSVHHIFSYVAINEPIENVRAMTPILVQ